MPDYNSGTPDESHTKLDLNVSTPHHPGFVPQLDVYDNLEEVHRHLQDVFKVARQTVENEVHGHTQIGKSHALLPDTKAKMAWDSIMLFWIVYCAIVVPVDIGVVTLRGAWTWMDILSTAFFCVDIFINFHTGFYDIDGIFVADRSLIAQRYLKTWLILDVLSTIPWDFLVGSNSARGAAMLRVLRASKLMRVLRVLKVPKLSILLSQVLGMINPVWVLSGVKLLTILLAVMIFTHWSACVFCALPWIMDPNFGKKETASAFWSLESTDGLQSMLDMDPHRRYSLAFYFVYSVVIDSPPEVIKLHDDGCLIFLSLLLLVRPLVACTVFSSLTDLIVRLNQRDGLLFQRMQALGSFMGRRKIPVPVQRRVLSYLRRAEEHLSTIQDYEAIKSLSPTLQREIAFYTKSRIVQRFKFFQQAFGMTFVRDLCQIANAQLFGPEDIVFRGGHVMCFMALVTCGSLRLLSVQHNKHKANQEGPCALDSPESKKSEVPNAQVLPKAKTKVDKLVVEVSEQGRVEEDDFVGAEALLTKGDVVAPMSIMAISFCEVVTLDRIDFWTVVERKPEWSAVAKAVDHKLSSIESQEQRMAFIHGLASGDGQAMDQVNALQEKEEFTHHKVKDLAAVLALSPGLKDKQHVNLQRPKNEGFHTIARHGSENTILEEVKNMKFEFDTIHTQLRTEVASMKVESGSLRADQEKILSQQDILIEQNRQILALLCEQGSGSQRSTMRPRHFL